jgi:undecaprenyl-diphosphatase
VSRLRATVALIVLGALVALVGPSRVYLGAHWPSDVVGAYLFAGAWLAATIAAYLWLKRCVTTGFWAGGRSGHRASAPSSERND